MWARLFFFSVFFQLQMWHRTDTFTGHTCRSSHSCREYLINLSSAHINETEFKHQSYSISLRTVRVFPSKCRRRSWLVDYRKKIPFLAYLFLVFYPRKDNSLSQNKLTQRWCLEMMMMMSWCLMSSDVIWHIRDKLWPMPKHGSIKSTYVRCMRV